MNVLHELAELDALLEGREDISDNGGPNTAMMVRQVLATALPAIASLIESEDIARGMVDASWMDRARQAEKQLAAAREDSARLDWLESRFADGVHAEGCYSGTFDGGNLKRCATVFYGNKEAKAGSIREAIDVAIATLQRDRQP